ncbi:prophage tail fiber N-terminal domain-containing protein [Escherichia coli]|nr:prophage tail fiber N-terminal domain-containing protein [Escherichia coli]EMC3009610.1 prophage tail fiber N-terminal domain-containing protein [Escherichia coli]EMC6800486.1 prophage tail fiber N-terminal domain-containing protein [Escherichia coli]
MKIKISGVLSAPLTEVCAGSEIQLKAVTTSDDVIIRAESSYFVDQDGKYNFEVYPGRYDVYIQFSAEMPQKVGRIGVYEDSKPGTLEEYLLIDDGGFFKPEALKEFEKSCADAAAAAAAAKTSETNSANNAGAAANSASAAHTSETNSANNAAAAANSASAAHTSETNSANNAAAAAASASAAEEAANRGGNVDVSDFAKINDRNDFTEVNYFKLLTTFSGGGLFKSPSTFDSRAVFNSSAEFYGTVSLGYGSSSSAKIQCYSNLDIYNAKALRLYSAEIDGIARYPAIAFFTPGSTFEYIKIDGEPGEYIRITSRGAKTIRFDSEQCPADGLKFTGKDRIERSLFHSGFLPPAAIAVTELPAEPLDASVFYFVESESKLYFVAGGKKFAVALEEIS